MELDPKDPEKRHSLTYPMEIGAPKFELVPVKQQKDKMLNVARLHAQQEYDRIMEVVRVMQAQAERIKHRLEITDAVHRAEFQFQLYHNQIYWLVFDSRLQKNILSHHGPDDWNTGSPESYEYLARVKWLGDYTWIEVDNEGNPVT